MKVVSYWDLNEVAIIMEGQTIHINGFIVGVNSICVNGSIILGANDAKLLQKELNNAMIYLENMDTIVARDGTDANSWFVKFFRRVSWYIWRRWMN